MCPQQWILIWHDVASVAEEDGHASEDDYPLGEENMGSTEPGPEVYKQ